MGLFTPQNQLRLTNVSVIRLKHGGKRFEVACYKNKILDYRNKTTTDLDQVLQSWNVFTNVSKGEVASKTDLRDCFGTDNVETIIKTILERGEIQLGAKERTHLLETLKKEIALIVSEKCIDSVSGASFTPSMIEKAMNDLHVSIRIDVSAKQQALDVLKQLEQNKTLNITRIQMKIKVLYPNTYSKDVGDMLRNTSTIVSEKTGDVVEMECLIDPGEFRGLKKEISTITDGRGTIQIQG